MPAIMILDQATLAPPGVADQARIDGLSGGQVVTLESTAHISTFTFDLLWVGLHGVIDTTSVASLAPSGPTTFDFTPTVGSFGSWAIQLTTDVGTADEAVSVRIFGIVEAGKERIPAPQEQGDPTGSLINDGPAVIARSWMNAPEVVGPFLLGTWAPWWRALANTIDNPGTGEIHDYVLDSSAVAGPSVFNTWPAAITAMSLVPGRKRLFIADGTSTTVGTFDLSGIELHALNSDNDSAAVTIVDGTVWSEPPPVISRLNMTWQGTTVPLYTVSAVEGARIHAIECRSCLFVETGGEFFFATDNPTSPLVIDVKGGALVGDFLDAVTNGQVAITARDGASLSSARWNGAGTSLVSLFLQDGVVEGANFYTDVPAANRAVQRLDALLQVDAAVGVTTTLLTAQGAMVSADSSAPGTTVALPAASTLGAGMGCVVMDSSGNAGTNAITINVQGGGTINGLASITIITDRGVVWLLPADTAEGSAVNDYRIVSRFPATAAAPVIFDFVVDGVGAAPFTYATFAAAYAAAVVLGGTKRIVMQVSESDVTGTAYDLSTIELHSNDPEGGIFLAFNGATTWAEPPKLIRNLSVQAVGRAAAAEVWDPSATSRAELALEGNAELVATGATTTFIEVPAATTVVLYLRDNALVLGNGGGMPVELLAAGAEVECFMEGDAQLSPTSFHGAAGTVLMQLSGALSVPPQTGFSGSLGLRNNAGNDFVPDFEVTTDGVGTVTAAIGQLVNIAGADGTGTITFEDLAATFKPGDAIVVWDRLGQLSEDDFITVDAAGADVINGQTTYILDKRFGIWKFRAEDPAGGDWTVEYVGDFDQPTGFIIDGTLSVTRQGGNLYTSFNDYFDGPSPNPGRGRGNTAVIIGGDVTDSAATRNMTRTTLLGGGRTSFDPLLTLGAVYAWSGVPVEVRQLRLDITDTVLSSAATTNLDIFKDCELRMVVGATAPGFVVSGAAAVVDYHFHSCDIDGSAGDVLISVGAAGGTARVHLHGDCVVGPDAFGETLAAALFEVIVYDPDKTTVADQNAAPTGYMVHTPDHLRQPLTGTVSGVGIVAQWGEHVMVDTTGGVATVTLADPSAGDVAYLGKQIVVTDLLGNAGANTITFVPPGGWTIIGTIGAGSPGIDRDEESAIFWADFDTLTIITFKSRAN